MIAAIILLFLFIAVTTSIIWKHYQKNRRGFRIRYLSPGILRAGPDKFAIEYFEGTKSFLLHGREVSHSKRVITIPSVREWETNMPDWAQGRRTEILQRLGTEL